MTKGTKWMLLGLAMSLVFLLGTMLPTNFTLADDDGHWDHSSNKIFTSSAIDYVGIGVTNPQYALAVDGHIKFGSNGQMITGEDSMGSAQQIIGISTGDDTLMRTAKGFRWQNSSLDTVLYMNNSDNLAVGHSWATERLHVEGNLKLSGSGTQKILSDGDLCIGSGC